MKTFILSLALCGLMPAFLKANNVGDESTVTPSAVAQGDPVERRTYTAKGTGYSKTEAERDAHAAASGWVFGQGGRSYRVLSQSTRLVGDIYVCTVNIEYFVRR